MWHVTCDVWRVLLALVELWGTMEAAAIALRALALQRFVESGASFASRFVLGETYLEPSLLLLCRLLSIVVACGCLLWWPHPTAWRVGWVAWVMSARDMLLPALALNLADMVWRSLVTEYCRWPLVAAIVWYSRILIAAAASGAIPATPPRSRPATMLYVTLGVLIVGGAAASPVGAVAETGVLASLASLVCAVGISAATAYGFVRFEQEARSSVVAVKATLPSWDTHAPGSLLPKAQPVPLFVRLVQLGVWNALLAAVSCLWELGPLLQRGPFHGFTPLAMAIVVAAATSEAMVGVALQHVSCVAVIALFEAIDAAVVLLGCLDGSCPPNSVVGMLAVVLAAVALLGAGFLPGGALASCSAPRAGAPGASVVSTDCTRCGLGALLVVGAVPSHRTGTE